MKINPFITKNIPAENDMLAMGALLAKAIKSGAIIYLYGDLGAGKTTFTRGFLRGLGYQEKVKSPTYTLVEPYEIDGRKIFHFDLYRLTHAEELEQIGIREYFTSESVCLIEWPEKGFPLLPLADLACYIEFKEDGREMKVEGWSDKGEEILRLISL